VTHGLRIRPARTALGGALALALILGAAMPARVLADADAACLEAAPKDLAPIERLFARVRAAYPGTLLKVEMESDDGACGAWRYEVKLLTGDGDVLKLEYDAVTLELLSVKGGRGAETDDDGDDD